MADKANKLEIQATYVTYVNDGSIPYDATAKGGSPHVGKVLMHTGDGAMGLVTENFEVAGKLIKVESDGFITVQEGGYADVPTDGSTITYTKTNNRLVGGATAGTVKIGGAEEAVGAVGGAKAIQSVSTGVIIAKFIG